MGSVVLHREFGSVFKKEDEITLSYEHIYAPKVFSWCVLKPLLNLDKVFFFLGFYLRKSAVVFCYITVFPDPVIV